MSRKHARKASVPPHGRHVRRRQHQRRRRYLIVCGGEVTEREYFKHMEHHVDAVFHVESKNRTPAQLAQWAAALKREDRNDCADGSMDPYAAVWVVVDVDDFHDHHEAQRICDRHGLDLIISNPCFEVWLVDHVRPCPSVYTMTRDVERYALKLGVTCGPRHKYINFAKIDGCMAEAVTNARRHDTMERQIGRDGLIAHRERDYAPWTDMVATQSLVS